MSFDKNLLGNDDEYKKESGRRRRTTLLVLSALLLIGVTTTAVIMYRNRDTDMHGEFSDEIVDNGIDALGGSQNTEEIVEEPEPEGDLNYVVPLVEMESSKYKEYVEIGRSVRDVNGALNPYQLCNMLGAISYGYSWMDTMDENAKESLNKYMLAEITFNSSLTDDDRNMFYETVGAMAKSGFDEAFNNVLFDLYLNPASYNGKDLTFNDFLFTFYQWYLDVMMFEDYKDTSMLYFLQHPENIEIFPFGNITYDDLCHYDSMWYAYYANSKGYIASHCFSIEPVTFYECVEGDEFQYKLEERKAVYAVPMVLNNEMDGNADKYTKEIMIAFMDADYNVLTVTPYNAVEEEDRGQVPELLEHVLLEEHVVGGAEEAPLDEDEEQEDETT